jgi:hypothetical protein
MQCSGCSVTFDMDNPPTVHWITDLDLDPDPALSFFSSFFAYYLPYCRYIYCTYIILQR